MKSKPECIVCMMKQALNTARMVSGDPLVHLAVLRRAALDIAGLDLDMSPAQLSRGAYRAVTEISGVADPYQAQKQATNDAARALLPELRELVRTAADPLDAALHAAVAGNVIDLGIGHEFDIERDVRALMSQPFALNAADRFLRDATAGCKLLYLGDNSGEIVFDQLLVEWLTARGVEVTFTVKSGPVINDATMADAEATGMTRLCRVIETGSADIGVDWARVSQEFRAAFADADVIVSKGHGNFETCNDRQENLFFLLKAKCPVVADALGCRLGDIVFAHT